MAAEVFGRGPDFDHRIDIPPGAYVPVFEKRPHALTTDTAIDELYPDISVKSSRPSVLIRPLRTLSGGPCKVNCRQDSRGTRLDYADIYVFDIPGFKGPLEKAFEFAQNGTRLSPDNQRCRASLAYIHLFRNDLLKLKPDFPARGRILIGHYIKFENIVERVIEGLDAVAIAVR